MITWKYCFTSRSGTRPFNCWRFMQETNLCAGSIFSTAPRSQCYSLLINTEAVSLDFLAESRFDDWFYDKIDCHAQCVGELLFDVHKLADRR
jgi:hypothetical protein